ncbi:MAG: MerR family transcriptional regulator [Bryobacteraceae bacterium]
MTMGDAASDPNVPEIPEKLFYRIGEVSGLLGVETHVLRYWETEFPGLAPKKSGAGHRLYRRKDLELLLRIKDLLYTKRFTIEGARQALQQESRKPAPKEKPAQQDLFATDPLPEIRRELAKILEILQ